MSIDVLRGLVDTVHPGAEASAILPREIAEGLVAVTEAADWLQIVIGNGAARGEPDDLTVETCVVLARLREVLDDLLNRTQSLDTKNG